METDNQLFVNISTKYMLEMYVMFITCLFGHLFFKFYFLKIIKLPGKNKLM